MDWVEELRSAYASDDDNDDGEDFSETVHAHEVANAIYEANRFTVRLSPSNPNSPNSSNSLTSATSPSYPSDDRNMGVFARAARLNHSCAPNVFHRYNPNINRLTIHALRDIAPGEELATSYIDICADTAARRQKLRHWGFKCRCVACESKDANSERRRRRIGDLRARLLRAEAQRTTEGAAEWADKDYSRVLKMVAETIELMAAEGLAETDTLGEAYAMGAEYALCAREWEKAVLWAEAGLEVERKCVGGDSVEVGRARGLVEEARAEREGEREREREKGECGEGEGEV